jgi:hypothetical protein
MVVGGLVVRSGDVFRNWTHSRKPLFDGLSCMRTENEQFSFLVDFVRKFILNYAMLQ